MIIIQTPLRVSLFGGGTDFPSYFREYGGCVLTSAIDKYIFVTIKKRFDDKLRIGYTKTEMVDHVDEIKHELIREALRKTGITKGVEITTMGDIPSQGSGLGSSSTVTVGSLHAMHTLLRSPVLTEQLAQEACEIEREILDKPIGIQDQYIAAYGGLRFMEFKESGEVVSEKLNTTERTLHALSDNLLLFYTGVTRKADTILVEQKQNIGDRQSILGEMKDIAHTARAEIEAGKVDSVGELLHSSWELKKQLATQISNPALDNMYKTARRSGALGGKISGAGGGGFLLLYCPNGSQEKVREALSNFQEYRFTLGQDGSKIIFDYQR